MSSGNSSSHGDQPPFTSYSLNGSPYHNNGYGLFAGDSSPSLLFSALDPASINQYDSQGSYFGDYQLDDPSAESQNIVSSLSLEPVIVNPPPSSTFVSSTSVIQQENPTAKLGLRAIKRSSAPTERTAKKRSVSEGAGLSVLK